MVSFLPRPFPPLKDDEKCRDAEYGEGMEASCVEASLLGCLFSMDACLMGYEPEANAMMTKTTTTTKKT